MRSLQSRNLPIRSTSTHEPLSSPLPKPSPPTASPQEQAGLNRGFNLPRLLLTIARVVGTFPRWSARPSAAAAYQPRHPPLTCGHGTDKSDQESRSGRLKRTVGCPEIIPPLRDPTHIRPCEPPASIAAPARAQPGEVFDRIPAKWSVEGLGWGYNRLRIVIAELDWRESPPPLGRYAWVAILLNQS